MTSRKHATLSAFNHKSSVLCPNTTHITSQYLALEQLKAHQNMVSHAKGSIDTTAPKSLQSYLSSVNRKKKNYWQQDGRISNQSGLLEDISHTLRLQRDARFANEQHDANVSVSRDENVSAALNKSIQAGIPFPQFHSKVADKISWYLEAVSNGVFQGTVSNSNAPRNNFNHSGSLVSLSSSLRSGKVVKGDLMDWHKKNFTPTQRPFSPRILANNTTKSKVSGMRCYNPPHKRRERNSINSSDASTFESFEDEDVENDETVHRDDDDDDGEEKEDDDEVAEEVKTEENTMNDVVDDMPIKGGSSHQAWLSEQALRAQIRRKLKTKTSSVRRSMPVVGRNISNPEHNASSILTRNEEDKYLKFLFDVTEDILRSGIYSDRAIQRTFDFHLQFCSSDADKDRMKQLLDQVLEGLQVPSEDPEGIKHIVGTCKRDGILRVGTPPEKETPNMLNQVMTPSCEEGAPHISSDILLPEFSSVDLQDEDKGENSLQSSEIAARDAS